MSRTIDSRPVERTTRRTVAVLLTFISLGVLSGPLASTSGAASTSGSLTFAGSLSGTVNLKRGTQLLFSAHQYNDHRAPAGKSYTVWIDYSVAKRGKTTNLKTGGENTSGDAVSINPPTGVSERASINGSSGTITVDKSKSGSINATIGAASGHGRGGKTRASGPARA